MRSQALRVLLTLLMGSLVLMSPVRVRATTRLELYGTFHTMGGGVTRTTGVGLLVGGTRACLPLLLRGYAP